MNIFKNGLEMIYKDKGFSLLEVMIALGIFFAMAVAFIDVQTANISSSIRMDSEVSLHNLAELKMNEVLLQKKEFTNATKNDVDAGAFEIEGFENFKYEVRITPIEFPDFSQIMGQKDEDGTRSSNSMQKLIFNKLKKNMEELLWQVNVKVINTVSTDEYELNSWVTKSNAKIDTNFNY